MSHGVLVTPPRIRVSNGSSPFWVKLNLPAIGHFTGTGSLASDAMHTQESKMRKERCRIVKC